MYWFGKEQNLSNDWMLTESWLEIPALKGQLAKTPTDKIISVLDGLGKLWNSESQVYKNALAGLKKESSFSEEEIKATLDVLPILLSRESLEARLRAEFSNQNVLDRFCKLPQSQGMVKASPYGIVLHVTAGNVFLSSIDSLIMGLLTKNLSILKVSSSNQFFPEYFAKTLKDFDTECLISNKFSILHWKGGDVEKEKFIKTK